MKNYVNKFTKIAIRSLAFIALVALSFMGVFSAPLMNVAQTFAATDYTKYVSSTLKLLKVPSSVKLGSTVSIPRGETDEGTIKVVIKNPKGETIYEGANTDTTSTAEVNASGSSYVLTPSKLGTYTVEYSVANPNKLDLDVQTFKIAVTGTKPVMEFEENSKYIIPSVANNKYQIVLPTPTVLNSEGEEVSETNVLNNLTISIKESLNNTSYTSNLANDDYFIKKVDNHYAFTPNAADDCNYTITYSYKDATTGLTANETFEVVYEKEFNEEDIKLGYKFVGTMPETLELGVETKLPTISVNNENDSEFKLSAYTDVKVVFIPNESSVSKYDVDDNGYVTVAESNVFTPKYPSTDGVYKITYNISDFYNYSQNKVNKTLVYSINDVKDSTAPITYAVADYTSSVIFDEQDATKVVGIKDDFKLKDVTYKIPTKVQVNDTVKLPAIYATDNVTNYENMFDSLVRVIVPESGSNVTVSGKAYEAVDYKFTTAGTYTIRYEAKDEAGRYNYTGTNFTIVVEDAFEDLVAPTITLTGIPSTTKKGNTISFNKPKVNDYVTEGSEGTEVVDKNLEVSYYYYTSIPTASSLEAELAKARNGETSALTEIKEDENNDSKLSFVVPASSSVTVVCVAYDDANNIGLKEKTINVVDITDNTFATIVTSDEDYIDEILSNNYKQDQVVTLPELVVTDDNVEYLQAHITVVHEDGQVISINGAKYLQGASGLTIENAHFTATKAGEYTVNYTISDVGGNYVVKSYMLEVEDVKAPTIELDGSFTTVEVGKTIVMPTFTVKDNGQIVADAETEIRFGNNNPSYTFNQKTGEFTALETGIFTYELYAKDSFGNETKTGEYLYTFEAKDTIKPTVELDYELDKNYPIIKVGTEIQPIALPGYIANDEYNNEVKESKVEVKSPSNKNLTVTKTDIGYEFTPTVDGVYTVIYTAVDNANNTTTKSFSIRIGDNTAPSISIGAEENNAPTEIKVGNPLTLKLEEITISDDGESKTADELINEYKNGYKLFNVTVTGPNGETVSKNGDSYEYTLSETGKYTITYVAKDGAGNTKTVKKVVEVFGDENASVVSSETWGVILIVVSLAILGGVVIYFVKTRDKKGSAKYSYKKDEDKKD